MKVHPTHFTQPRVMPWNVVHIINGRKYYFRDGKYVPCEPTKRIRLARTTANIINKPTGGI